MSVFGYNTIEERILDLFNNDKYTKQEKIKALLNVAGYINHQFDDESTEER